MSDHSEDAILDASTRHAELLLYDFYKHMTTLSLVTLGGILSISQTSGVPVPVRELMLPLACIVAAGLTSLYGMESIIKVRIADRPIPRRTGWYRVAASGSFALGVGSFLGIFSDRLQ